MIKITEIEKNSIAEELGINCGDFVVKINRRVPKDKLDMIYFDSLEKLSLTIMSEDGVLTTYKIQKDFDEKLGITLLGFEDMSPKWCANKCMFCFVDQLPKGMRKTLYVKDDDWRFSFVTGSYVTLTNLSKEDIKRICSQKFSPLYVSVHATDQKTRLMLLGRKDAPNIVKLLKKFGKHGVICHTQAVVCPGINDGEILDKTIKDLSNLYPMVKSLAVVPVGLTGHRDCLNKIKPYDKESANKTIDICEKWQKLCKQRFGDVFVYPSDELYLKAEREFMPVEDYGEFDQIENGIGLIPKFENEFMDAMNSIEDNDLVGEYTILTGVSATEFMTKLSSLFMKKFTKVKIEIKTIKNNFFGQSVTVAGLIVGRDIVEQTNKEELLKNVIIPRVMMKETENVFLDGMTLDELKNKLNRPIFVSGYLGSDLVEILKRKEEK